MDIDNIDKTLIRNAIKTPDGTILESKSRHDYKVHIDENGEKYMIDGGLSYVRTSVNNEPAESLAIYTSDDHTSIRENLTWGTYGKDGLQPLQYVALKDMDSGHIKAVMDIISASDSPVDTFRLKLMQTELDFRESDV
jgi:hypothetical protein